MIDPNCSCNQSTETCYEIEEESLALVQEIITISVPQCPFCLGRLNGRAACRMYQFPQVVTTNLNNSLTYLPDDARYQELYVKGYDTGLNEGYNSEQNSITDLTNAKGSFLVGSDEFGETYHIAAAMLCGSNLNANLQEASVAQIVFFSAIFDPSRCLFTEPRCEISRNSSTELFAEVFQNNQGINPFDVFFRAFTRNIIQRSYEPDLQEEQEHLSLIDKLQKYLTSLGLSDIDHDKAIIWIRSKEGESSRRNLNADFLRQILEATKQSDIKYIILAGHKLSTEQLHLLTQEYQDIIFYDLTQFENRDSFKLIVGDNQIAGQIVMFKVLQERFNVKCAIGMMSGAMDGPAFTGLPTVIITHDSRQGRIPLAGRVINTLICVHYDIDTGLLENPKDLSLAVKSAVSLYEMDLDEEEIQARLSM